MELPNYKSPESLFIPTGPWSLLADTGPLVFLAGIRGIDPTTNKLETGDEARARRIFDNIELAAEAVGLSREHIVHLRVFVTDMARHRPLINAEQLRRWGKEPCPPRTILEVSALNQSDTLEVEAILARPSNRD